MARLRGVIPRLARQLNETSTGEGLTPTQYSVLALVRVRGPLGLAELTELEGLNPTQRSAAMYGIEAEQGSPPLLIAAGGRHRQNQDAGAPGGAADLRRRRPASFVAVDLHPPRRARNDPPRATDPRCEPTWFQRVAVLDANAVASSHVTLSAGGR